MQHFLWICGHLAVAERLLVQIRCLDGTDADPEFTAHFPIGGPVKSAEEHDYPSPEVVRTKMDEIHAQVLSAIRGMSEAQLDEPCYGKDGSIHPHYKTKRQAIAHCARHEGFHAGQIAMIRRLMGKAFLR
jgi:uncharacterized damage-inducible protein DinB